MNASRTALLASLLCVSGLAAAAQQPDRAARSLTDITLPHSERSATSADPRGGLSGFVTMRDELENYTPGPVGGGNGISAPPASFTGPIGFDWGLNTLRGINAAGYTTLVDLSGSPVGDNDTTVLCFFTVQAQVPGQFFTGANIRWTNLVGAVPGFAARGAAEHYISTIAEQRTFEGANATTGFTTSRLLWGGTNDDDTNGLPVGAITHFYNLEPIGKKTIGCSRSLATACPAGAHPRLHAARRVQGRRPVAPR